eukprot:7637304-Pyramimonas_sp.AAC.1
MDSQVAFTIGRAPLALETVGFAAAAWGEASAASLDPPPVCHPTTLACAHLYWFDHSVFDNLLTAPSSCSMPAITSPAKVEADCM